jgi:hypothetical protein
VKLSEVSSRYGAPMGRRDTHGDRDDSINLIVHHCPFVDGDYDEGGAYWGAGEPLWRAISQEATVEFFFRAKDRRTAVEHVREQYPHCEILPTPRERWFEEFVMGYETAALWSSSDGDHESLEEFELDDETKAKFRKECAKFCDAAQVHLVAAMERKGYSATRAGHDFWLTRCGHGTGYWDRDELTQELKDALTQASKAAGERNLYLGDDGLVYQG